VKINPLITFFILAIGITWTVEIPLALVKQGIVKFTLPFSIHYLAVYGPLLAALIDGSPDLKALFACMFNWRVRPLWWLIAFSPLIFFAISTVALRFIQREWIDPGLLGRVDFLPDLGLAALPLWILTYGLGEETGCGVLHFRGFRKIGALNRQR